jgi:hypothetical protein
MAIEGLFKGIFSNRPEGIIVILDLVNRLIQNQVRRVKVSTTIRLAETPVEIRCAARLMMVRVFPVLRPARTSR